MLRSREKPDYMNWYVLYTKPRAEKKSADELEKMGMEVFCPMITEIRQWSDRKKKVTRPLFTSYIFVRLMPKERNNVFQVPGVVRYLHWLGKPAIARDEEIETIQKWLNDDHYEDVQVKNIEPGDKVTLNSGALKGKTGIVQKVGKKEIRLTLESLGFVVVAKTREVV